MRTQVIRFGAWLSPPSSSNHPNPNDGIPQPTPRQAQRLWHGLKRWITRCLAAIGALTLVVRVLPFPNVDYFEKRARAEFGSPQAIAEIAALFTRVEAAKGDPALETITYTRPGGFHRLRRIPASRLADRFEDLWRRTHQGNSPSWGDVLACYDADDTLVGIEFYASRYGCFATRDATRCPPGFDLDTLHRLANQPILVIIRVAAPD